MEHLNALETESLMKKLCSADFEINLKPNKEHEVFLIQIDGFEIEAIISFVTFTKNEMARTYDSPPEACFYFDNIVFEEINVYKGDDCVTSDSQIKESIKGILKSKI